MCDKSMLMGALIGGSIVFIILMMSQDSPSGFFGRSKTDTGARKPNMLTQMLYGMTAGTAHGRATAGVINSRRY